MEYDLAISPGDRMVGAVISPPAATDSVEVGIRIAGAARVTGGGRRSKPRSVDQEFNDRVVETIEA